MIIPTGALFRKNVGKPSEQDGGRKEALSNTTAELGVSSSPAQSTWPLERNASLPVQPWLNVESGTPSVGGPASSGGLFVGPKSSPAELQPVKLPGEQSQAVPGEGDRDYSSFLCQQTTAAYSNLLKLRHQRSVVKSGIARGKIDEDAVSPAKPPGGPSENAHLRHAITKLVRGEGKHTDVAHALRKVRKKSSLTAPKVSPVHYSILRNWLVQRRQEETVEFSDEDIDEELFKLMVRMREARLGNISREKFYKIADDVKRGTDTVGAHQRSRNGENPSSSAFGSQAAGGQFQFMHGSNAPWRGGQALSFNPLTTAPAASTVDPDHTRMREVPSFNSVKLSDGPRGLLNPEESDRSQSSANVITNVISKESPVDRRSSLAHILSNRYSVHATGSGEAAHKDTAVSSFGILSSSEQQPFLGGVGFHGVSASHSGNHQPIWGAEHVDNEKQS